MNMSSSAQAVRGIAAPETPQAAQIPVASESKQPPHVSFGFRCWLPWLTMHESLGRLGGGSFDVPKYWASRGDLKLPLSVILREFPSKC